MENMKVKECYYDASKGVTIDLMLGVKETGALITRIEVHEPFRGKGYASEMMKEVIKDADEQGVILFLTVDSDGTGLGNLELRRWYFRLGFQRFAGTEMFGALFRLPKGFHGEPSLDVLT